MRLKTTRFGLFSALCSLFFFSTVSAQLVTKNVDDGSDGTLRQEIADTPAGGTVSFAEGIETLTLTAELLIEKELKISADSTARVTIDAQMKSRIFNITAGPVTLSYLNLVNGSTLQDNGGAINAINADITLNFTDISASQASNGGAAYIAGATDVMINHGTIQGNLGFVLGGGFYVQAENTVFENVLIDGNGSDVAGGGIFNSGGDLRISGCTISKNAFTNLTDVSNSGAGIYNSGGNLTIINSTVNGNDSRQSGGGILSAGGNLEITDSKILGNSAQYEGAGLALFSNQLVTLNNTQVNGNGGSRNEGGAILANGNENIIINGGTIENNLASRNGGGIFLNSGVLTINGALIAGNSTNQEGLSEGGGGIYNGAGTLIINAGTYFTENRGEYAGSNNNSDGGGILIEEGSTLIINSPIENPVIFQGNLAYGSGGALAYRSPQPLDLNNVVFTENTAFYGGALHILGKVTVNITGGTFSKNGNGDEQSTEGGALWNDSGTINLDGTSISENYAFGKGGGIYNNGGTININNVEIKSNIASDDGVIGGGGAIYNTAGGNLTITNTLIKNNSSYIMGGAIVDNSTSIMGTVSLTNVIFKNNSADAVNMGVGGALYMQGSGFATINSCEFSDNFTNKEGGAIWNDMATINIKTSTISGNYISPNPYEEPSEGKGGGIYNSAGSMYIDASTVVFNKSENIGGGIYNASLAATTTLKNSIVALNTAVEGNNFAGENSFVSADYNLVGEDSLAVFPAMSNDLEGTFESPLNPMIDVLADNGGFTQTHALLEGSPAFNSGNPIDNFLDQRGETVFGGRRDIGAFEAQTNLGIESTIATSDMSLLYPNPSINGFVQLNIPDSETSVSISVIEMGSGKIVLSQAGQSGLNVVQTDGLNSGMYVVRLVSDRNVESLKMLVAN